MPKAWRRSFTTPVLNMQAVTLYIIHIVNLHCMGGFCFQLDTLWLYGVVFHIPPSWSPDKIINFEDGELSCWKILSGNVATSYSELDALSTVAGMGCPGKCLARPYTRDPVLSYDLSKRQGKQFSSFHLSLLYIYPHFLLPLFLVQDSWASESHM